MWKFLLNKAFKAREKFAVDLGTADMEKPFLEHLEDLRTMIVRMAFTLLFSSIATFVYYKELISIIVQPLIWAGIGLDEKGVMALLISTDPTGPFMTAMNVALIAAVIVSFPFLLFFLLQFIMPGLRTNEKKLLFPAIAIGAGLFFTGVCFSYYLVLPKALKFFFEFGTDLGVRPMWALNEYITFSTRFVLVFGVSFELPVLVMALVKLDILNYKIMKGTRSHAIVAIAIFAAVITPTTDPLTMMLMAGPLYVLYEICIWLAYYMEKKDREAYPEYYQQLEEDEKAMAAPASTADWDNEEYNPWSTDEDKADDDHASSRKSTADTESKPASEAAAPDTKKPAEVPEKSLEESSREDENRNTD